MSIMKIKPEQAQQLLAARSKSAYERKSIKKCIFADIHREHGIPSSRRTSFFIESPDNPDYCVIRDKRTKQPLSNGLPAAPVLTVAPASSPAVAVKAPASSPAVAVKAPAKKAAVKAPAKKAAVKAPAKKAAVKAPAKKAAVKAPAKKAAVKAPAKKAAVKAPAKKAAVPTVSYPKDVRVTLDGKRIRLGVAKDAAHEKRLIAAAKKERGIK